MREIVFAILLLAFLSEANATTVSIGNQNFAGNAPVLGTPTPALVSGSFIQSTSGNIPATVNPIDWLLPGGPLRVQLSPYAFNTDGTNNASYSVLDSGSGPVSSATYNVNSDSFTLLWGSPDSYNQASFFSGSDGQGMLEGSFSGPNLACGKSTCQQTGFDLATFVANGGSIGSVTLTDNGPAAFEYGISQTPIPSSIYLFGSLLLIGALWLQGSKHRLVSTL